MQYILDILTIILYNNVHEDSSKNETKVSKDREEPISTATRRYRRGEPADHRAG